MGLRNVFSRLIANPLCPVIFGHYRKKNLLPLSVLSCTLTTVLFLVFFFLLYPTSHCLPSSQNLPLGLLCSRVKINGPISSTISLFALSKSCFSCLTLKGCLFFHLSCTPTSWCRVMFLTITPSQYPVKETENKKNKTLSLCNCCTLEFPGAF